MKRLSRLHLLFFGLLLTGSVVFAALGLNAGETPKKIRVIYTNDTLGTLAPCG